jgi:hypothetical protein
MCLSSIFELRATLKGRGQKISSSVICNQRPLQRTLQGCRQGAGNRGNIARVRGKEQGTRVPRAYGGNAEGLLRTRRAQNTTNSILTRNQARRHRVYSGNYPEHLLLLRTHKTPKPSVSQGLTNPATSLIGFNN